MRLSHASQRGMALVMAMIVIVLVTLLVAGAITFTGTERAAAMIQSDEDAMSACTQAARNLFLSRVRVLLGNADSFTMEPDKFPVGNGGRTVYSGHIGRSPTEPSKVNIVSAKKVALNAVGEGRSTAGSIENRDGYSAQSANYYLVTAVCQDGPTPADSAAPLPPQREIEFVVRVGL